MKEKGGNESAVQIARMSRKRETDRNERVQNINRQVAVVIQLLLQLGRVMLYAHAIESKRQKRQATNIKEWNSAFCHQFLYSYDTYQ